jgi:AcrR family transcriptional regulator
LFAEKGYAGTTIREIVAHAGVTKPVLYYYFESKAGIFRAILDDAAEQQKAILAEAMGRAGTVLERLIHLCERIYQGVLENRDLLRMIHHLLFGPPQGAPKYDSEQYHRRMVDAIKAIYVEGIASGEAAESDPEDVALVVISLIDFSLHMEQLYPESLDPGRPERLLRLAFRGIGETGAK